jgi:sporulation protein YlmC with PRC-barrel domain
MSLTLTELKGKPVYTQDARRIGEVADLAFKLEDPRPSLVVRTPSGRTLEVPWTSIAAAKDIILLKPEFKVPEELLVAPTVQAVQGQPAQQKICPYCGRPATWIPQYQRWYCYHCKRYID